MHVAIPCLSALMKLLPLSCLSFTFTSTSVLSVRRMCNTCSSAGRWTTKHLQPPPLPKHNLPSQTTTITHTQQTCSNVHLLYTYNRCTYSLLLRVVAAWPQRREWHAKDGSLPLQVHNLTMRPQTCRPTPLLWWEGLGTHINIQRLQRHRWKASQQDSSSAAQG